MCDAVAGCAVVECAVVGRAVVGRAVGVRLKNKEFTGCLNLCEGDYSQKENRQRIVISSACCGIYFRNRNRIVRSRFRLFFCYGSNSGVGSYTFIISRAANRNPIVNACNSCLSEISASAFSNCSSRVFCCSVSVDQYCRNTDFQVCSWFLPLSKPNTIPQSVPQAQHFSK